AGSPSPSWLLFVPRLLRAALLDLDPHYVPFLASGSLSIRRRYRCAQQHYTGSTVHKSCPRAPTALKLCIVYQARNRLCGSCTLISLSRLALAFPSARIAGGAFPMMSNHDPTALGRLGSASRCADGAGPAQIFRPRVPLHGWSTSAARYDSNA
ncbi:hypothetical protein B0H11DRAFT_621937, partial [Mycena galericulata]